MIGAGHCELCPAGYSCPGLLFENIKPCGAGYFSALGNQECVVIEAGKWVNDVSATDVQIGNTLFAPVNVATGYQSNIGDATPVLCPPGYKCTDTWRRHNVMCPPGSFYLSATMDACTTCPIGKFCPADIGGFRTAGITCPAGTYSFAVGATECKPCPPGFSCAVDAAPVPCPINKYQAGGSPTCTLIPIGFEGNFGQTIAPCPSMFYAPEGGVGATGNCKPCPAGSNCYTPAGTEAPDAH